KVKDTEIMHSARNEKMDEAAKKAVKKMRFNPAVYNGEPVEYWIKVPVEFDKDKFRIDD
ncbi:TonB family protein, partial [bacterium]|nr:TonB family protein [bacterium]